MHKVNFEFSPICSKIKIMFPGRAPCLPTDCCFSELAIITLFSKPTLQRLQSESVQINTK